MTSAVRRADPQGVPSDRIGSTLSPGRVMPPVETARPQGTLSPDSDDARALHRYARSFLAPLMILLPACWLLSVTERTATPSPGEAGTNSAFLDARIDPNTAPWWELNALPRIGEVMARRIVAFREQRQSTPSGVAFSRVEDLDLVPGIGPKTVERLRPFLRFDAPTEFPSATR